MKRRTDDDDSEQHDDDELIEEPLPRPRRRSYDQAPIPVDVQNLPPWLRAAVFLGVPSVIALFLVYVLTTQMASRVTTIERTQALQQQTLELVSRALAERQTDADQTREHFDASVDRIERLLRYTCAIAAERDSQRAGCERAAP